ncbi:pilus assembly protein CpaB [Murinocardiopsis flavida]|uniref:Pilus assembly protein CpaB n=1 Tax=Murinocardiopsis flavida TaxID=645275 RepID=A0A2P8D264_9ACTN|nr:Flp pilus assembly protein CpaB [Murinocardiopsis flavida]PSK91320.1 pilus assembly protein CpaB [Murinocardiopsis flavida]
MNPRQRRGILLMIVAGIGAIAVFFTVVSYVNTLNRELGTYKTVLRLTQEVPAYQPVTDDMVEKTQVPAKFYSNNFLGDLDDALKQPGSVPVSSTKLPKGSYLQKGMVIAAPKLEAGEREVAVMVDAETGVAGKVSPGSRVDVYATMGGDQEAGAAKQCALRALTDVQVLEVGVVRSSQDAEGASAGSVPVTFRLDSDQTLLLTQVEAFSETVRLGLVSPEGSGDPGAIQFCNKDIQDLAKKDRQQAPGGGQ